MAKDVLCIEIGNEKTKLVYGNLIDKKIDVKSYTIYSNSDKSFNYDGGLNINEVLPQIMSYFKKIKAQRKQCYVTISNENIVVRTRELPMVRMKELAQMVNFEAEQFLPYNIEEFYIDYRVINEVEGEGENANLLNTMIVAVPKESVNDHVKLLTKSKQKIKVISPYTDAICNYANTYLTTDETNVMIADIGEKYINMNVFQGHQYYASINSEVGTRSAIDNFSLKESVDSDIAKDMLFGIKSLDDIENYKNSMIDKIETENILESDETDVSTEYKNLIEELETAQPEDNLSLLRKRIGSLNSDGSGEEYDIDRSNDVYENINNSYYEIYREINRMVDFFRTRKFGTSLDSIYLCGGGANLVNIKEYLQDLLGIEVKCVSDSRKTNLGIKEKDYNLLIPAMGSALGR